MSEYNVNSCPNCGSSHDILAEVKTEATFINGACWHYEDLSAAQPIEGKCAHCMECNHIWTIQKEPADVRRRRQQAYELLEKDRASLDPQPTKAAIKIASEYTSDETAQYDLALDIDAHVARREAAAFEAGRREAVKRGRERAWTYTTS